MEQKRVESFMTLDKTLAFALITCLLAAKEVNRVHLGGNHIVTGQTSLALGATPRIVEFRA